MDVALNKDHYKVAEILRGGKDVSMRDYKASLILYVWYERLYKLHLPCELTPQSMLQTFVCTLVNSTFSALI